MRSFTILCNIYRKDITILPTSLSQLKFSIGTFQAFYIASTVIITNHYLHIKHMLHVRTATLQVMYRIAGNFWKLIFGKCTRFPKFPKISCYMVCKIKNHVRLLEIVTIKRIYGEEDENLSPSYCMKFVSC